jgi:hypothetical protein
MKRFDRMLLKVFLYGLPVFALLVIFAYFYGTKAIDHDAGYARFLNNGFFGFVAAMWMALAIYLSVRLLISAPFRDQVLARITFIRERDEREALLTGKAAKTTFLTTLAFLIFLFCLSCFQVSIYRVPPEMAVNGKTGNVTLGLGFDLLNHSNQDRGKVAVPKEDIFSYRGLPLSSAAVILLLIVWQIIAYNCVMRRLLK